MSTASTSPLGEDFPLPELMSRFRKEWARQRDSVEVPITRIASFNLLVVSQEEDEETLQSVLDGLEESHPSRLIWTKVREGRSWEESRASLRLGCRCHGTQVCSEQIQISCGSQPERVTSIVLPLIRAGLSTHLLWWKGAPEQDLLFQRLADRSKLVILEEESWPDLSRQLLRLWSRPPLREHNFMPLAWYRLLEARQQIAAAYARGETSVTVPAGFEVEFALLCLWVATLLAGETTDDGFRGEGFTLERGASGSVPLLRQGEQEWKLPLSGHLQGVRVALNRPRRDRVFAAMMDKLQRRQG